MTTDPVVPLTSALSYSLSRIRDWHAGRRPLPGGDPATDRDFFEQQIRSGLCSEGEAAMMLRRHRELQADDPEPRS